MPQNGPDDVSESGDGEMNEDAAERSRAVFLPSNSSEHLTEVQRDERRQRAANRRLNAGGAKFRIVPDFTYLEADKYQCAPGVKSTKNVDGGKDVRCTEKDVVTKEKREYIKALVKDAIKWFQDVLRVLHPIYGHMKVRKYCYQYAPPSGKVAPGHWTSGKPETERDKACGRRRKRPGHCDFEQDHADFILTVTATPTKGSTLAWATACLSDEDTGRPLVGLTNFGPARLSMKASKRANELATAIHEIAHALGFSASQFGHFIDHEGKKMAKEHVVRSFDDHGAKIMKIVTPRVKDLLMQHFDCFDWPDVGAELENYGGSGSAGSHWEKRLFHDDFMTSTDSQSPVFSSISLALFEDTGWYQSNYEKATHFHWGYKQKCPFVMQKCKQWDPQFFCKRSEKSCSHNRFFKAKCNLNTHNHEIDIRYRYFDDDNRRGGADKHADYCPYYQGFSNDDCRNPEHGKKKKHAKAKGEVYGEDSRCFDAAVLDKRYRNKGKMEQRCYIFKCDDNVLFLTIGGVEIECPRDGGVIEMPKSAQHRGKVTCPPASELCFQERDAVTPDAKGESVKEMKDGEDPCKGTTPLMLEEGSDALAADIEAGKYVCFEMILKSIPQGKVRLGFKGLQGYAYFKALELDLAANESLEVEKGGKVEHDDGLLELDEEEGHWPTEHDNDLYKKLEAPKTELMLQEDFFEHGTHVLIVVAAPKGQPTKGSVRWLGSECAAPCQNGGMCVDGACDCRKDYAGIACEDRKCPGDCSARINGVSMVTGQCNIKLGRCECNLGYSGKGCENVDDEGNDYEKGTVEKGKWAYFWLECPEENGSSYAILDYELTKDPNSLGADPFLFAMLGKSKPTESHYAVRDVNSWRNRAFLHTLSMRVATGPDGGATIGVWNNGQYTDDDEAQRIHRKLVYTGKKRCQSRSGPPCPRGGKSMSICNQRGECKGSQDTSDMYCQCHLGWTGKSCEIQVMFVDGDFSPSPKKQLDEPLKLHEVVYAKIKLNSSALGKKMKVRVYADKWMGISLNAGHSQPLPSAPRNVDAHNFNSWRWKWKEHSYSWVVVNSIHTQTYTVMISNPKLDEAKVKLQVQFDDDVKTPKQTGDDIDSIDRFSQPGEFMQEYPDPSIPITTLTRGGSLPQPVLVLTSRATTNAMVGSRELRLLKVESTCTQSRLGFLKCSTVEGKLTICTDGPATIYHGLEHDELPRDVSEFKAMEWAIEKAAPKMYSGLSGGWRDDCKYHLQVKVDEHNNYIGVAAGEPGHYIHFVANMEGDKSMLYDDQGGIRQGYYYSLYAFIGFAGGAITFCMCYSANKYNKWVTVPGQANAAADPPRTQFEQGNVREISMQRMA